MLLKAFHVKGGERPPVNCTRNSSLVGAYQVSRKPNFPPMLVCVMLEMKMGALVEINKWKSTSMP